MAGGPFSEDDLLDHVRGMASPKVSNRIDAMAARDPALRAELALMRGLGPALKADDAGRPPGEFGWRRLEKAIRRGDAQHLAARPRQVVIWRAAAAILMVAVLGQAGYIITMPATEPAYRTAFGTAEDHVLGIAFAPGATAGEIGDLLRRTDARVIDGPSALGLYRVAFTSAEASDAAATQFRTSPLIDLIATE